MEKKFAQPFFQFSPRLKEEEEKALIRCRKIFEEIDQVTEYNQCKMLKAFIDNGVSESHFAASTGYGYDDRGRETIDKVFAQAVGAQDALVRHNFVCGTHALTVARHPCPDGGLVWSSASGGYHAQRYRDAL